MKFIKRIRKTVFLLLIGAFPLFITAQTPINVNTQVIPPYSPYFADYIGSEGNLTSEFSDLLLITVQNMDMENSYRIKLIPSISSSSGVSAKIHPDFSPSRAINLSPGEVRVLNLGELKALNSNLTESQLSYTGIDYRELIQSGVLPEGVYEVCMMAFDYETSTPLSAEEPMGCSSSFFISNPEPPRIVYPTDGSSVPAGDPQNLMISWTPPPGGTGIYEYELRIIELSGAMTDPYYIMNNSDVAFYRQKDLMNPGLLFDMSKPEFEPGKRYALRVTARDQNGEVLIKNDGQSEIHVFSVMEDTLNVADEEDAESGPEEEETFSDTEFACGGDCDFDLSGINRTPVDTFSNGDTLKVGHFEVLITSANWSGNQLSGEGKILSTDFIPVAVKAKFRSLQVNESGRAFAGKVVADAADDVFSNQSMTSDIGDRINLPDGDMESLYNYLTNPDNLLSNLQNDTEVELPVGIGSPGDNYQVAVVGLIVKPGEALFNTVAMIKAPEDRNKYLKLGAKNVCINPGGIAATDSATLYLMDDVQVNISDDVRMQLNAYEGANGTYASFGCEGFRRVYADGEIKLSPEIIRYENADGSQNETDTVSLSFATNFTDWSDWLIRGNLFDNNQRYQFPEMQDYSFYIQDAVIDHSDLKNDPALVFPDQYASTDQNATWKGLYIKTFNMMMPRFVERDGDRRIEVIGNNILIDQHGVSTFLEAHDLVTRNEGTIGDWEFSMDYLALELVASHLDSAALRGELLMPVSDSAFDYRTAMSYISDELSYDFNIATGDVINVPMWYAEMDLYESSALDLSIRDNNDVTIEATLNGKLSLDSEVGDFDKVVIRGLEFERLIVSNKPNYLRLDGALALDASTSPSLLGFGVNLGGGSSAGASFDMGLNEISSTTTSFYMDMGINFTGASSPNSLAGNTRLNIEANYDLTALQWKNAGVAVEEVGIDANMGIMEIHGRINFFKNDPVYGKGFQGMLSSKFLETVNVDVEGLFGALDDYRYFYVDGTARWTSGGIGFFGLGLYGFGGGVAYNMKNTSLPTTGDLNNGSGVQSDYEPDEGSMGLKATVVGGLQGDPRPWNSDVSFEVGWNNHSGLTRLDINGDSYFMQELLDRTNPEFKGSITMSYDFQQRIFSGTADKDIRIPADDPMITGDMPAAFHFEFQPNMGIDNWYVKLGEPDNRIRTTVQLTEDISFTNGSYFMVGSDIPGMPNPPQRIINALYSDGHSVPSRPDQSAIGNGAGFAHGLKLDFSVNEIDAAVCYIDAGLLAGYDISVMNWSRDGVLCNGRSNFGVNNWYARGQVYFLANAHFYGKGSAELTYFRTSLAALAEGGLPNPTGIRGKVKATFQVGPATWSPSKSFYLGEICNMTVPEGSDDITNPYEDVEFINRMTPSQGDENVSPSVVPEVEFNYAVENEKDYVFADGAGGSVNVSYKIGVDYYIEEIGSSNRIDLDVTPSSDKKELEISMNEQLKPETYYEMVAEATLYQKSGSSWEEVTEGNDVVKEEKRQVFKTTLKDELAGSDIDEMVPVKRQRYFKKDDYSEGYIRFVSDMSGFFDQYADKDIKVQFISHDESDKHLVDATISSNRLSFNLPALQNETIYKLKVLAMEKEESSSSGSTSWSVNNGFASSVLNGSTVNFSSSFSTGVVSSAVSDIEIDATQFAPVLYEYHFRTSMFNTLQAKLNSLSEVEVVEQTQNISGQNVRRLELRVQGPERFEGYMENSNYELEFDNANFRMQHNSGIAGNFLPDWYLNDVSYSTNSSQSWTTKAKNQVLRQSTAYQAFGQEPYSLKNYYGPGTLPSYFNGPLTEHDIQYGWEPDYSSSSSSGGSSSGSNSFSTVQNISFSTTYFTTDYSMSGSNEETTTVMAVKSELEKEIYQEYANEVVSAVEVAKQFQSGGPGSGPAGTSVDLESAEYVPMPDGSYKLRIRLDNGSSSSKTIYFNF